MNVSGKNGYFVDFYDLFPRTVGSMWQPFVTVAPLGNPLKGQVILHEQQVNKMQLFHAYKESSTARGRIPGVPHALRQICTLLDG